MKTPIQPICIDLADGSHIDAMLHVDDDRVIIDTLGMQFIIRTKSAYELALRLLILTDLVLVEGSGDSNTINRLLAEQQKIMYEIVRTNG